MGRIEELPDDVDEKLHISNPAPKPTQASPSSPPEPALPPLASTTPALPPALAEHHNKSATEILASLNRTPLFMTALDETDGGGGENVELEALKALAYEGTPLEVAANFREQGNECFRERKWKDAVEFYSKGLAVLGEEKRKRREGKSGVVGSRDGDGDGEGDAGKRREGDGNDEARIEDQEEQEKMLKMEEALLLNRAACNLELQNYRRTILDCAAAIRLNPSSPSPKAYYRTTVALLRLSRLDEADDALKHALQLAPRDASLLRLRGEVEARRAQADEERRRRLAREERALKEKTALETAIKARGWVVTNTDSDPGGDGASRGIHQETVDLQDAKMALADSVDPQSVLHLPLLFLYPVAAQSDFIKSVPETATLAEQLQLVLPVPWEDPSSPSTEYGKVNDVECFVETITLSPSPSSSSSSSAAAVKPDTTKKGLTKVGKKIEIAKILGPPPNETSALKDAGQPQDSSKPVKRVAVQDGLLKVFIVPRTKTTEFIEEFKRRNVR